MKLTTVVSATLLGLTTAFGPGRLKIESNDTSIASKFVDIKQGDDVSYAGLSEEQDDLPTFKVEDGKLSMKEPNEDSVHGAIGQHELSGIPVLSFNNKDVSDETLWNHANSTHLTAMGIENFYVCDTESDKAIAFYVQNKSPGSNESCTPVKLYLDQGSQ